MDTTKDTTGNVHPSAQHSRPQGFGPCDKRRRSKGRVDDGTPQIKGFRISVQHQKLEAKRVMRLLRLRVILVPARALDPCRALATLKHVMLLPTTTSR